MTDNKPIPRMPNDTERLVIIGRTGSGKTRAGVFNLSHRSWNTRPWLAHNSKGDDLLDALIENEFAEPLDIGQKVPDKPGLYISAPIPEVDDDAVDAQLWDIWARGGIGFFADEGTNLPKYSKGFRGILTQGRSKQCPVICCSQRPVDLIKYVWSEASFYQVFALTLEDDRKRVASYIPIKKDFTLKEYHSLYYDVSKDILTPFSPVPSDEEILDVFDFRKPKKRRFI